MVFRCRESHVLINKWVHSPTSLEGEEQWTPRRALVVRWECGHSAVTFGWTQGGGRAKDTALIGKPSTSVQTWSTGSWGFMSALFFSQLGCWPTLLISNFHGRSDIQSWYGLGRFCHSLDMFDFVSPFAVFVVSFVVFNVVPWIRTGQRCLSVTIYFQEFHILYFSSCLVPFQNFKSSLIS